MDQDTSQVAQRLEATLAGGGRLVLWQDELGTFRDSIGDIRVSGATVVDATGAELATKRRVLVDEPTGRFVIYRAGKAPAPTEDLIYDLRLRAKAFSCSQEGLWAEECGVPVELADVLAEHAAFFRSRSRVRALATSDLPRQTRANLEFAMTAATLNIREGTRRDVARAMAKRVVTEEARGRDDALRALRAAGLEGALWGALGDELGYRVPTGLKPSAADLAFRLVEGSLGELAHDEWRMSAAEASRVLSDLARDPRTTEDFNTIASRHGHAAFDRVPKEDRSYESLEGVQYVGAADEWMLMALAADAAAGHLDVRTVERVASMRADAPCAGRYRSHYATLVAMARLDEALKRYGKEVASATSMEKLLVGYASAWHEVDRRYRELRVAYGDVASTKFAQKVSSAVGSLGGRYDTYLADSAARWQDHLLDGQVWPPAELPSQSDFFRDNILRRVPEATHGHRIGVIVSDALRYECAAEFAERLRASRTKGIAGKTKVEVSPRLGMVPSYTQLGMAALLPAGTMEIDPATARVTKDGKPTQGTEARLALIGHTVAGSVAYQADDLPQDFAKATSGAPVVWVYHNAIDRVGDKLVSERKTFRAVEEALEEMEKLVARLLSVGCGTVYVTSDHGFIYQDRDLTQGDFADVHGLSLLDGADGVDAERGRRFVVSNVLPKDSFVIEYGAHELSLAGSYRVGVPRAAMRFRVSGSGARFVHGGVSPQELVIPVVSVTMVGSKQATHPSGVSAFSVGRPVITGPVLALDVYQEEPVGESVSPVTVKVGVYDGDGNVLSSSEPILVLDSASASSEERKRRVRLQLTDDVDDADTCFARVTRQVGATNNFKTAWEREYRVQRFAQDF